MGRPPFRVVPLFPKKLARVEWVGQVRPIQNTPVGRVLGRGLTDVEDKKQRLFEHLRRNLSDARVLDAMSRVPRDMFVPEDSRHLAYEDIPLPIGGDQTTSQPLIVAMMVAALALDPADKVLEVGTGSGYQACVLSLLAGEVVTVERLPDLANAARERLASFGCGNVAVRPAGDVLGCPEEAPFDAIVVAAAAPRLPRALLDQLVDGGRIVIPVGSLHQQELHRVQKDHDGYSVKSLGPCRFVPLIGPGAWGEDDTRDSPAGPVSV